MAQSSPKTRRIRQLKRERNRAWRELDVTYKAAKEIIVDNNALTAELKRYIAKYGELPDEPVVKKAKSLTEQLDAEADTIVTETQPKEASIE